MKCSIIQMMQSNTNLFAHHSTSIAPASHHPPLGGGLHQAKTVLQSPINQRRAGDASLQESQVQERKGQIKHSQSLEKLMSCEGMEDTLELCEVFVILGPNEESLKTTVKGAMSQRAAETLASDQQEAASLNQAERASLSLQSVESSYLLVNDVPLRKEPQQSAVIKVKPDIIDTYPSIYQDLVNYEDSAIHQLHPEGAKIKEQYLYLSNIQSICFPDGYFVDTEFSLEKIKLAKQKVMHFTITQSSGDKKFLTCLEYKELLMVPISDSDEKSKASGQRIPCLIPRILLLVSRLPFFTTHLQMLSLLYSDLQASFMQTFASFHQLQHYSLEDCFQLASSQQRTGALEFYVSAFIHHYRIDGSHLQVEVGKASSKGEMPAIKWVNTFERRYGSLRIENYEFQMLFQRVRPQLLMQIFVALLHERKVILILGGHGDLSSEEDCCKNGAIIIETLLNLMYPLQWNFTNISNLIPSMIDYLEAPFPFILCVSRSLWRQIYETRWSPESCPLGDETLAFDLDSQKVYVRGQSQSMSSEAHLPELPQPYTQLLIQQLERQMLKTAEVRSLDISEEVFWKQFTLKVKQQFLNFLIFLINTFENFYNQDGLVQYPRGNSANEIFNFTDYMQNVQENRGFFKKFVQTQAFINFIEQAHTMQPREDIDTTAKNQSTTQIFEPHLDFFKLCTRKLSKENIQAVRQMQDEIIANILSKYTTRSISYPLDKCLTLYEAQLKLSLGGSQPTQKGEDSPQPATLSIISQLNHDRIIRMQPFDPKVLIQSKYNEQMPKHQNPHSKRGEVKHHKGVANSIDMRAPIATNAESTLRMVLGGGVDYQLRGGRDDLYFSKAATPKQQQSRAISQHPPLSHVIKVEDNMDVEEDSIKQHRLRSQEPQHLRDSINLSPPRYVRDAADGSPSEEGETTNRIDLASNDRGSEGEEEEVKGVGIMGFFKKTFSSVKKTFESTFNQQKPPSTKVRGARPKSRVADEDSRRPSLLLDDNDLQQSSPRMENMKSRVRFANEGSATVVNRATRSQTFHVTYSKNQKQDDQEGGFFANLFGFSARKQRNEESLDDNLRMNQTQQVANSQGRHKLNNSGFFVFNEEDMKKMTEMSPKDATARSGGLRATSLDFPDIDALPKPKIKGQSIFTTGGHTYQSNRLRSISYQQPGGGFSQTQSGLRVALNDKRYLEKERYVEESLQLIEQFPHKGQSNKNVMFSPMIGSGESRQISGAFQSQANAKSEVRKNQPPLVPQTPEQRLLVQQSTTSLMHKQRLLFNHPKSLGVQNQLSLIKEDPLNLSAQGGDSANPSPTAAAGNAASQRVPQNTSDFEAVYKQSIEGTKFAPKNLALNDDKKVVSMKGHSGKAQTFNIWKSRSGKVELKGGSTPHAAYMTQSQVMNPQPPVIQVNMTALAKPPKQPSHPTSQVSQAAKQRKPLKPEEKKNAETIARRQFVEHQSSRQNKLHLQAQTLSPPSLKQQDSSVLSEENTTSIQASIDHGGARESAAVGRGLHQFRYVMSGTKGKLPFERGLKNTIGGLNSSQNIIKKTSPQSGAKHESVGMSLVAVNTGMSAHRRHISQGMTPSQSISIGIQPPPQQIQASSTEPPLPNMTLENIEPDEDDQENFALYQGSGGHLSLDIHGPTNQPSFATHLKGEDTTSISRITHKQIENMQVGRVRRKSGATASHSITVPATTAPKVKQEPSSGRKVTIPTTLRQIWGKLEYTNRSPESRQVKDKSPSTKKKEVEEEKVQIVTYKHIQAKTVESNSSESDDLSVQDVGTVGLGLPESHNSIFYPPQPGVNPRKYLEDGGHLRDSSEVQDAYQNKTGDHALDQTKQIIDLKKHHHTAGGGGVGNTVPHRVHSLSQYADHNQAKRLRPTLADLRSPFQAQSKGKVTLPRQQYQDFTPVSSHHNAQEAFSKEGVAGGASSPHQRFGGHHPPSAGSNAPTNNGMMKPLNKITWDSFSQIAKLSGDVDHEPSTPKSGRGGNKNSSDEENEIE